MRDLGLKAIRVLASGLAAAVTWWAGLIIVFGPAQGLLADPNRQSAKFLAAFTQPPLPRMADGAEILALGLLAIGLIYAATYAWLESRLSGSAYRKGLSFGLIAWALMVPWFEFYLPWNVMREPFSLVLVEALCWLVVLLAVGLSISMAHRLLGGHKRIAATGSPSAVAGF